MGPRLLFFRMMRQHEFAYLPNTAYCGRFSGLLIQNVTKKLHTFVGDITKKIKIVKSHGFSRAISLAIKITSACSVI